MTHEEFQTVGNRFSSRSPAAEMSDSHSVMQFHFLGYYVPIFLKQIIKARTQIGALKYHVSHDRLDISMLCLLF